MNRIKTYFKGCAMGVADVIPGVSGGTLALILGIYERLIGSLKNVSVKAVTDILKSLPALGSKNGRKEFMRAIEAVDALFLITLGAGIISAVLAVSSKIPFLIVNHTAVTFATFMGLIIPSIFLPWKMIKKYTASTYVAFFIGLAITIGSTLALKIKGIEVGDPLAFSSACGIMFGSAFIAICAMILPGISGSFILMLLGQYIFVTGLIAKLKVDLLNRSVEGKEDALLQVAHFSTPETAILLGLFMIGCASGILIMSRVIHKALKNYHDITMAFLTGMIASSIYVLWPFKADPTDPIMLGLGKAKWLPAAHNTLPNFSSSEFKMACTAFVISLILSTLLIRRGEKREAEKAK
jgi:putative membrane protein